MVDLVLFVSGFFALKKTWIAQGGPIEAILMKLGGSSLMDRDDEIS